MSWFPSDRWAIKDKTIPSSEELRLVRVSVESGKDDILGKTLVTVSGAHKHMLPDSAQGLNRCGCKKTCTSKSCKCRKNGTMCYSGCGCGGNCDHSQNMSDNLVRRMETRSKKIAE